MLITTLYRSSCGALLQYMNTYQQVTALSPPIKTTHGTMSPPPHFRSMDHPLLNTVEDITLIRHRPISPMLDFLQSQYQMLLVMSTPIVTYATATEHRHTLRVFFCHVAQGSADRSPLTHYLLLASVTIVPLALIKHHDTAQK